MRTRRLFLAGVTTLIVAVWSSSASADLNDTTDNAIKGSVGLGLVGADLTLIIEGALGVKHPALLSVIPIVVAAGGAVGGYYLGQASAEGAVASLVSGLALIIPAAILVAYGRSYKKSRDDEDEGFSDRTEEGMPAEVYDEGSIETAPVGETETEVIGPEENEETEEIEVPTNIPPPDESSDDSTGLLPIRNIALGGGLLDLLFSQKDHKLLSRLTLSHF